MNMLLPLIKPMIILTFVVYNALGGRVLLWKREKPNEEEGIYQINQPTMVCVSFTLKGYKDII